MVQRERDAEALSKLKALAVSGGTRMASLLDEPTFAEASLPGFDGRTWYGVLAPAGTAKDIVQKLSAEIGRIVALPDFRDKLHNSGMNTLPATSEEFGQLMKKDFARYKHIIHTANIKIK